MTASEPAAFTVATYNVRNAHPDLGHEWRERAPLVTEVIRRIAPDVVGLQEVLPDQLTDIRAALPEYGVVGRPRDAAGVDEACPVLWRLDRFSAIDTGQFWLSGTPDIAGSNTWRSLCPRCATWVRLRGADGQELLVVNTHLDHEESPHGDRVRRRSVELIAERVAGRGAAGHGIPAVLTGDMNAPPDSPARRALAASGLRDAADVPGLAGTFHDYGRVRRPPLIDGIFHTAQLQLLAVDVVADELTRAASDHHPLVARLGHVTARLL